MLRRYGLTITVVLLAFYKLLERCGHAVDDVDTNRTIRTEHKKKSTL